MSDKITEDNKIILTGRIYPAIQSCVNNRYKIITGYFALVAFLVAKKDILINFVDSGALTFITIIFTIFIGHNLINYWLNSKEQWSKENNEGKNCPKMEIASSFIMFTLIWSGYVFLRCYV